MPITTNHSGLSARVSFLRELRLLISLGLGILQAAVHLWQRVSSRALVRLMIHTGWPRQAIVEALAVFDLADVRQARAHPHFSRAHWAPRS